MIRGVWQLQRLSLNYCKSSGSSRGMRKFIENELPKFQEANKQLIIETKVKGNRVPHLIGYYKNGKQKSIEVANKDEESILSTALFLRNQAGRKHTKLGTHDTQHPSIEGVWTPEQFSQINR